MGMLPPVFVELRASIGEFSAKMAEARHELTLVEAKAQTTFAKTAAIGKGALLGTAVVAAGISYLAVEMADKYEEAHVKLEQALKNAGGDFEELKPHIDSVSQRMENFGFTNAETEDALATLTTALQSPKKAMEDMGLVADLAKYKHMGLSQAALLVAKAQEGQLRPLKALGIDLPIASAGAAKLEKAHKGLAKAQETYKALLEASQDPANKGKISADKLRTAHDKVKDAQEKLNTVAGASDKIMEALSKRLGGQAAAASETLAGKLGILKADSENLFKDLGMKLIPILLNVVDKMRALGKFVAANKKPFEILAAVIGTVLVGAISAYITTLVKSTIASAKSFAIDLINAAKWVAFRIQYYGFVAGAAIVSAATTAAAWIAANAAMIIATGGILLAIGLLVAAGVYLKNHWHEIMEKVKEAIHKAADWIHEKIQTIKDTFHNVFTGLSEIVHNAFNAVGNIIKGYFNIWIGIINFIVGALNGVIDKANKIHVHIPGMGTVGVNIPHIPEIPKLANGGIVSRPTIALIGEAGPEAVVPLSKGKGFGGNVHVTVNVHGSVVHEKDLAVSVRDNIAILMRRQGLNPSILGV